jgi:hypothetical protein
MVAILVVPTAVQVVQEAADHLLAVLAALAHLVKDMRAALVMLETEQRLVVAVLLLLLHL